MQLQGNGYSGSSDILVSTANQEIIPPTPETWTNTRFSYYKFDFVNSEACHVKINGGDPIFLDVNQGISTENGDARIFSFIIVESGISYQYLGAY